MTIATISPDDPDQETARQELLVLRHEIRIAEQALEIARKRRKWSNISLALGPVLIVVLYAMWWLPWLSFMTKVAISIPTGILAGTFLVAWIVTRLTPGGPSPKGRLFFDKERIAESKLELELSRLRDERKHKLANSQLPITVRRIDYKEDAHSDIEQFRTESKRYRNVNNLLQGLLIVGSLAATGTAGVGAILAEVRWAVMVITFLVGIASGFMAYFKYKERSFYLQQTADTIEEEWDAYEIGVGRYKRFTNSKEDQENALSDLVEEVHRLKSEQKKREQNLEQPPGQRAHDE